MNSVRRVVALQASPEDALLCAQEPIHIPGAIQPHGAFLAAGPRHGRITHASANLAAFLGVEAAAALGQPIETVLGVLPSAALLGADPGNPRAAAVHVLARDEGAALHLRGFRAGAHLCVDIEPLRAAEDPAAMGRAQAVRASLEAAGSQAELCERAVRGLKSLSAYDRVMAYRFDEDGHGEVMAEAREMAMMPYLGLHFPASDIPAQARMLFLRQRTGAVADSAYAPVPLLADATLHDGAPLDLTFSGLRSVSPVHREYMRNMKTAASLTVALVRGGQLWGMLVCHHATPRIAGPELRATADMVGQVVSLILGNLLEAETAARRGAGQEVLAGLAARLAGPLALPEALAAPALPGLVGAGGAAIRAGGRLFLMGQTPPEEAVIQALAVLQAKAGGNLLAVEDLALRHPELAACGRAGSGALLLPLTPGTDDAILWFRPERARTVTWGGDPAAHASRDPVTARLAPRASFAAWEETVSGHAAPWAAADLALARELRELVGGELARRARRELAALRDELAAGGSRPAAARNFRGLLEAAPDAMIVVNEAGLITLANLRAVQQFGYPGGQLLGRAVGDILPQSLAGRLPADAPDGPIAEAAGLSLDVTARRQDGGEFPAEITLSAMQGDEGRLFVVAIRNVSVRKNAETHLQKMETRYRNLLEASPDVMVMINAREEIVLVNRQAVAQFGYSSHQLIGQSVRGIIREGMLDEQAPAGSGAAAAARRTLERTGCRRDGSEFPVEITIGPLAGDSAGLLTAAIRDISVRQEAEAALRQKVAELNRSNMELEQFASIASHDLQEPLRMVASYTQLLARRYKGKLDDDADMFINYAVDGATRMRQLIQDLLAYSRVGAKGFQLGATASEAALETALVSLRGAIRDSNAAVTHDPLPIVLADARQLAQLFQNLVGNAIKYHGSDSPVVHISAARINGGRWEFSVRDNGLGIDPQHYQRIFGMFQRLHGREDFEGTGIGLAICKKIVEGHGGVIAVSSVLGAGSVFRFTMAGVEGAP